MIIFNGLAEGSYHYLIKAKDTSGNEYTLVSSDFNIGNLENSNTEPLTSSLITTTTTVTNTTSTIIEKDLELSETEVYIKVGEKNIINANQGNLTYTSSDESIAIVSNKGIISGLKNGQAIIMAVNNSKDTVSCFQERQAEIYAVQR